MEDITGLVVGSDMKLMGRGIGIEEVEICALWEGDLCYSNKAKLSDEAICYRCQFPLCSASLRTRSL